VVDAVFRAGDDAPDLAVPQPDEMLRCHASGAPAVEGNAGEARVRVRVFPQIHDDGRAPGDDLLELIDAQGRIVGDDDAVR
jgi:hypothetical protein